MKAFLLALVLSVPAVSSADLTSRVHELADEIMQNEKNFDRQDRSEVDQLISQIEQALRRDRRPSRTSPICVSNGEFGGFEKFALYSNGRIIGNYTSLSTCESLKSSARLGLACGSNGEFGGFEEFAIFSRNGQKIGGYTSLSTCKRSLSTATRDYICVSNGDFGGFEEFALHHVRGSRERLGGWTSFANCSGQL